MAFAKVDLEGQGIQNGTYVAHLNKNWNAINSNFQKIKDQLNAYDVTFSKLIGRISDIENYDTRLSNIEYKITDIYNTLSIYDSQIQKLRADIGKNASDINNLQVDIANHDDRLKKIEDAVFGMNPIEINDTVKPEPGTKPTQVINTDSRKKRKEEYGW